VRRFITLSLNLGAFRGGWLPAWVRRQFQSDLARSATWMLNGQGLQLVAQFAYFVVVAHVLGPTGYGTFVACTALVLTVAPFSPWGTGHVMVKYAARNPDAFPTYFGNAILVTIISGLLLTLLLLLVRRLVLPPSVTATMVVTIAIADLICTQLTAVCSLAFLALNQARSSAQVLVLAAGLRLIAALVLVTSVASPLRWAYLYAAAAAIATTAGIVAVSRRCGGPRLQFNLLVPSIREGFHFATSISAQTIYDNIDKTMLARLSTVEAAAIYAVAYRFIEAAMLPIRALAAATYPEFFRQGERGVSPAYRFARRILRRSVLYGIATSIALFIAAGLVPLVMGKAYAESSAALRWLCILPLIKSVHAFLTDTLTGANYQWQRSSTQIAVAVFNILINLWLIRVYSWRGAAWSSVMTDFLLMGSLYIIIRWHLRRERSAAEGTALVASAVWGG
jgi:O-antigen/teichoic acid export membrane protein